MIDSIVTDQVRVIIESPDLQILDVYARVTIDIQLSCCLVTVLSIKIRRR